jgi:hypothetical protein
MVAPSIGNKPARATAILRSAGLTPFRQILDPPAFVRAAAKPSAAQAVLIPEVVFWLMALTALGSGSFTGAVVEFCAALPQTGLITVTEEAFCLARGKLSLRFFLSLFADVPARFAAAFGRRFLWKGFGLLGVDGMDHDLPADPHVRRVFPPAGNQHGRRGRPQARLVGLVGLADGLCHAFRWTSLAIAEQVSARALFATLGPGDLVLADRNFPDLHSFAVLLARGADFLFHLPSNRFLKRPRLALAGGHPNEWLIELDWPARLGQRFPGLAPVLRLRVLQYQRPGFRTSWLITSLLDAQAFRYEELGELYHQRWRQETFHREWKYSLQLSNLRSHSARGLLKEVLVQLTINNAVRWIMAEAADPADRPVDLQFLAAKRLILAATGTMAKTTNPYRLLELYQDLRAAIRRQRILVRPGRSYPRRWDARGRPKGHGRVAQPARLTSQEGHRVIEL